MGDGVDGDTNEGRETVRAPTNTWRRYRALGFRTYLIVAIIVFLVLAVLAKTVAYFTFDVAVSRAVQSIDAGWFAALMIALSWPGFGPQTWVISALAIAILYQRGLIWEAIVALVQGAVSSALGIAIKALVDRPRPGADMVHVVQQLESYSFPSGHVLYYTTFIGFLFYLTYTLHRANWVRTVLLILLGGLVALIGVSRIYEGQHWASDVIAAYLLGTVCLSLAVLIYERGKPRFFVRTR